MSSSQSTWSEPTSADEAHRLAAGRRHYNAVRQAQGIDRAVKVVQLLKEHGFARGVQAQIARELGVHRSTITRDVRKILSPGERPCPICERMMSDREWDRLNKETAEARQGGYEDAGPSTPLSWLDVVNVMRQRGLLEDEDELPVEDDLGLRQH